MNKKEPERNPSKPVMKRGKGDLPPYKNIIVILFNKPGDNKKQEKETTNHPCPPHKPLT